MLFTDTYLTIDGPGQGIYRDRGSKFVAFAFPLKTEDELKTTLSTLKSAHPKANHYCWAMRLTADRSVFRLNDDGEPSGTAGRPILNTLLSKDLTNLLVIVVRYFGGTLLGVPGLINAYRSATEEALKTVKVVEQTVKDIYTVTFDYRQTNEVMKIIKDDDLEILSQHFDNRSIIKLGIRKTRVNKTIHKIQLLDGVLMTYENTV